MKRNALLLRSSGATLLLVLTFCLTCLVQPLVAGELDDFEEEATAATAADTTSSYSSDSGGGSGWAMLFAEVFAHRTLSTPNPRSTTAYP